MALNNVIRKVASRVVPLAIQASARKQRYLHHHHNLTACISSVKVLQRPLPSFLRRYSTHLQQNSTDLDSEPEPSLLEVIESEIQCAVESQEVDEAEELPQGFPFKIEDHAGKQTITLTKETEDETISVEVHMPDLITGDDNENDRDDDEEGDERASQYCLPMVVRVSKKNKPCFEFGCTAYPDEIEINSLTVKDPEISDERIPYEGPDFTDLDEKLQKSFHKYLEIRGIKPSTTNYLYAYMVDKDSREYVTWLKNIQKFVEA